MTDYPRECDPPQLGEGVLHVLAVGTGAVWTRDGVSQFIADREWETFRNQVYKEEEHDASA